MVNGCVILYVEEFLSKWTPIQDKKVHHWFYVLCPNGKIDKKYATIEEQEYGK